ncbi:hypothetical protein E1176_16170 [Fulvivirga sp. RKSG066]|uniref:hypothetical protein n=1 Tax=Fulvivirga aurantia TaxID=2529383 RepID=UPI0012BCC651|nr:hypothetical protein [Fulvivirga aurantia]MTI22569.1 hypothetical protein [Fulvivirga aurantia]
MSEVGHGAKGKVRRAKSLEQGVELVCKINHYCGLLNLQGLVSMIDNEIRSIDALPLRDGIN